MPKKTSSKKLYFAIILIVIIAVSAAAVIYVTQFSKATIKVGVHVGDTFTYKLIGVSNLTSPDAVTPDGFSIYNDTKDYTVTVTGISGTNVTLNTVWELLNGTQITSPQTIDISNGNRTDTSGFWALYPSNLNKGDLLSPKGLDKQVVNDTQPQSYANSTRLRNFWQIAEEFQDTRDPTGNTQRFEYDAVYFDRQTGMLAYLENHQYYNNPQYDLTITWQIVSSNVWDV
ncbi:MAG: hypothetical protein ABSA79_02120 [Candidatus Bathyarchaeia archaeon]|jgi:hypothetical protein